MDPFEVFTKDALVVFERDGDSVAAEGYQHMKGVVIPIRLGREIRFLQVWTPKVEGKGRYEMSLRDEKLTLG